MWSKTVGDREDKEDKGGKRDKGDKEDKGDKGDKEDNGDSTEKEKYICKKGMLPPKQTSYSITPIWQFCIFCCCLLLLVGCQSTNAPNVITVQVQRVVSGHTIDVLNPTQQPALIERVRLIGIEAPDLKQQPWGEAAKNRFEQMISKKVDQQLLIQPVLLEPDLQEKDTAGRWLAYVWQNDVLINEKLVEEGYVLAAPRSPNKKYDSRIARAQEYARIMGTGIWNPNRPMRLTPVEFRRQNP